MKASFVALRACAAALLGLAAAAAAQQPATAPDAHEKARMEAGLAAKKALQRGPLDIPLLKQAQLHLPAGYGFIPRPQAVALMDALGNQVGKDFLGLVVPLSDASWMADLEYDPSGYIRDDDAKTWNADKLLDNLKRATKAGNKRRLDVGMPPIEVTRWIQPPAYDSVHHRLVWSAEVRQIGAPASAVGTANYNTYVLGREGFVSLDLVARDDQVDRYKPDARTLLAAIDFDDGKRYGDFNSSTDKVAAYGLAALVGGVVAKKLGLLALLGAGLAKFGKLIALAVAGAGTAVSKWFKRSKG